jgi:hypothetical protein
VFVCRGVGILEVLFFPYLLTVTQCRQKTKYNLREKGEGVLRVYFYSMATEMLPLP